MERFETIPYKNEPVKGNKKALGFTKLDKTSPLLFKSL